MENIDTLLENTRKLGKYDVDQLERLLTVLPYKIQEVEQDAITLQDKYEESEHFRKITEADFKLKSIELKNRKELTSEGDRSAWTQMRPEVQVAQRAEREAKKKYRLCLALLDRYKNQFVAVRKFASMVNDTDNAIGMSQKYL